MDKIVFIDVYKESPSRISKDTAGGYGTENDFGIGLMPAILKRLVKFSLYWPNLMFAQLYTEIKKNGDHVDFVKVDVKNKLDYSKYDYIFICNSIVCFETELNLAKSIDKSKKIFLCGDIFVHTNLIIPANFCILTGNYDYLVSHMQSSKQTLDEIHNQKIANIEVEKNYSLSLPSWNNDFKGKAKNYLFGYKTYIPYISTRGCPYSCYEYCTYPLSQGKKVKSTDHSIVIKDLIAISKLNSKAHVVFRDPVFSVNKTLTKDLLKKIIFENLNLTFTVELHLNNLDDELIQLMQMAKVKTVKFGIESSDDVVRDGVKRFSIKNSDQKKWIDKLSLCKIKTVAMYILCQPDDTVETVNATIDYAIELGTSYAQFSIFTPYPGTPYYDKNKNNLTESRFEMFNQYNLVYKHSNFTKISAKKYLGRAYTKYYLNKLKNLI
jgi:anaerobic magnesium-protoporphyrin IX monomethyl ester cyclase